MNNLPDGADLLAIAREALLSEIRPLLDEGARYTAAMIANAMAIVARESAAGEAPGLAALARLEGLHGGASRELRGTQMREAIAAHERRLAADIRAGRYDSDDERRRAALEHLTETVRARLRISNPRALDEK